MFSCAIFICWFSVILFVKVLILFFIALTCDFLLPFQHSFHVLILFLSWLILI